MSQSSLVIADGSGAAVLSELTNALAALGSWFYGATDPATSGQAISNLWWADSGNGLVKQRNATNSLWTVKGTLLADGTILWSDSQGADIASAATTNLGTATGNTVNITGVTTITALGTATVGTKRTAKFVASLTLTYSAVSLILPGGANIVTAANDSAEFVSLGGGNWLCINYQRASGQPIAAPYLSLTGGTLTGALNEAQGVSIASAATTSIGTATGNFVTITGAVTITSLGAAAAGTRRIVKFASALTLTYNAASLILPGAANFIVGAGDILHFMGLGGSNWQCAGYQAVVDLNMNGDKITGLAPGISATDAANLSQIVPGVQGGFKNLKITNGATPNTQVALTADQAVLFNAANAAYLATGISLPTISTGSVGANALDAGTVAASTWYSVWVIYNGVTVAGLLSTSATAPTLPSGYTYKARLGWVKTDASSILLRILQLGRNAQYLVTSSSNTAAMPLMSSGIQGSVTVPTWIPVSINSYIPSTAAILIGSLTNTSAGANYDEALIAPNNSYGALASATNPPPIYTNTGSAGYGPALQFRFMLESTNIYWASSGTSYLWCLGWEDNI